MFEQVLLLLRKIRSRHKTLTNHAINKSQSLRICLSYFVYAETMTLIY